MQAETAYNVIQALPEAEKERLYAMLDKARKPAQKAKRESKFWTKEECAEILLMHLEKTRERKYGKKPLKVVE